MVIVAPRIFWHYLRPFNIRAVPTSRAGGCLDQCRQTFLRSGVTSYFQLEQFQALSKLLDLQLTRFAFRCTKIIHYFGSYQASQQA